MDISQSSMRRELVSLVPAALQRHVSCFAFSDEHPADKRPFELVVCTSKGEVLELYSRNVTVSICLRDTPKQITIFRTKENLRYYLILTFEKLYVISTEDVLKICKCIENVDHYVIEDPHCTGTACVRLWYNDDAVPVTLDDNFESTGDSVESSPGPAINGDAFVTSLRCKLTEARHTVALNEKRHNDLLQLRQTTSHTLLQDLCPNSPDSLFSSCEKLHEAMTTLSPLPWLKLCSGKVVLGITICNNTERQTFTNIKLVLQNNSESAFAYNTQFYSATTTPPFWKREITNELAAKTRAAVVAVADVPAFTIDNKVRYNGVIVYQMEGSGKFLPLLVKDLCCLDTLNESSDLLSSNEFDNLDFLALLASTYSLQLQIIQAPALSDEPLTDLKAVFAQHLNMDCVLNADNMLIHRKSPYHVLHGVTILFGVADTSDNGIHKISVFSRNKSQIPSLLHLMYDGVPYRLIVTVPGATVTEKSISSVHSELNADRMDIDAVLPSPRARQDDRSSAFADCVSAQMGAVLQYLDECMLSMAASKSSDVVNLIGSKIDFYASGHQRYLEFVCKMNEAIKKANKLLI